MKRRKMPDLKQAGNGSVVAEFAQLAAELAQLNPARFRRFAAEMTGDRKEVRAVRKPFAFSERK